MSAWCAALRLPFFVPSVLLYATGALAGARDGGSLDWLRALLGLAPVLLVQAAAILTNEAFDADHDAVPAHVVGAARRQRRRVHFVADLDSVRHRSS
jgi:1,4-dihydroxy-2-naphthoate octaprenyltransferase